MWKLFLSLCIGSSASASSLEPFRFVPLKRIENAGNRGLPPRINAVFEIYCNQTFVKLIRHEENDSKGVAHIFLGALVKESAFSSCAGETKEVTVPGGQTYSGRAFEVEGIELFHHQEIGGKTPKKSQK